MCIYSYMCVYIYIYIHTHTCTHIYIYTQIAMSSLSLHIYICIYIYIHTHTYTHIYTHTHLSLFMLYMLYIYTYMHTHIHTRLKHLYESIPILPGTKCASRKWCAPTGRLNWPNSFHQVHDAHTLKHTDTHYGSCQGCLLVGACLVPSEHLLWILAGVSTRRCMCSPARESLVPSDYVSPKKSGYRMPSPATRRWLYYDIIRHRTL